MTVVAVVTMVVSVPPLKMRALSHVQFVGGQPERVARMASAGLRTWRCARELGPRAARPPRLPWAATSPRRPCSGGGPSCKYRAPKTPHFSVTKTFSAGYNILDPSPKNRRTVPRALLQILGPFSGRAGIGPAAAAETCLLGDVALRRWRQKLGAIANCTNTVLGAGTLGVPAAIGLSGLAGSADRQELRGEVP